MTKTNKKDRLSQQAPTCSLAPAPAPVSAPPPAWSPQEVWQTLAFPLRKKIGIGKYKQWVEPLTFGYWQEGCIVLFAPTPFYANHVRDNYGNVIKQCWKHAAAQKGIDLVRVDILTQETKQAGINKEKTETANTLETSKTLEKKFYTTPQEATPRGVTPRGVTPRGGAVYQGNFSSPHASSLIDQTPFNESMDFENFICGEGNGLAHQQAIAYTENYMNGKTNTIQMPLFICGEIGQGKTHLLHAVGRKLLKHSSSRIMNLSAERFRSNFVNALMKKKMVEFKKGFRNIDVLLMDDMQFLSGTQTQNEFLQILNFIHSQRGLLVMASTTPPAQLDKLEEPLRSRLSGGLVVDIYPADKQLRQDIIRAKLRQHNPPLQFPPQLIQFLADNITNNIRELEGALNRLVAHTRHLGKAPDKDHVRLILRDLLQTPAQQITVKDIQKKTAEYFDIPIEDLLSQRRQRAIVRPRQIAMFLAKELTPRSLPDIGQRFGGRDHTTVLHAVRKVEELCQEHMSVEKDVANIKTLCQAIKKRKSTQSTAQSAT